MTGARPAFHGLAERAARRFDVLAELYRLLRPWRAQLALTGAAVVISTAASLVPPYVAAKAIDDGIEKRDVGALDDALIVLVVAVVVYLLTSALATYASAWVAQRALASLRSRVFAHLQVLSPSFYDRAKTGELISRLTNDVEQLENLVAVGLTVMGGSLLALVGTLVAMFALDAELALIALWVFPATFVAVAVWGRIARPRFRRTRDTIAALSAYLQETLAGIRIVRSFGQEPRHRARFRALNQADGDAQLSTNAASFGFSAAMSLLPALGVTLILVVGGLQLSHGTKSVGVVVAFISYFQRLFAPLGQLRSLASFYTQGGAALDKINALLDERPAIAESPRARALERGPGEVRFEGVSFTYDGERTVLDDLDLTFPAGQVTAIVGENGAGKSTLVSLIARFYDPVAGRVLIDGHDVRDLTLASLRRNVSFSLQDTSLLSGSVRDNVRLAEPDASDEEIEGILAELGGLELVRRLPEGLDTAVGEAGASLSAGQRQVVALTRTILADPSVFILDEFTSGLDVLTEARLLEALDRVLEGRTRIVIAHRLGMVKRAENIVVIESGRAVEQGDHKSLMACGGVYAHLREESRRLRVAGA
jgi:ABC-type multidrug transport system fused ATPase/permease subunit